MERLLCPAKEFTGNGEPLKGMARCDVGVRVPAGAGAGVVYRKDGRE